MSYAYGTCTTDQVGCFDKQTEKYVPLVLSENTFDDYFNSHIRNRTAGIKTAGWGNRLIGVASLIAAVAAVAIFVVTLPVAITVIGVGTAAALLSGAAISGVVACQNLIHKCF